MKANTPQEKRDLAKYLQANDPDSLAFLKASAEIFGPADGVRYENREKAKYPAYPKADIWQLSVYGKRTPHWMKNDL